MCVKTRGLAVLDDLLALDVELVAFVFEQVGDQPDAVAEDVQVDVGALADVAGHDAADQPRPERRAGGASGAGRPGACR